MGHSQTAPRLQGCGVGALYKFLLTLQAEKDRLLKINEKLVELIMSKTHPQNVERLENDYTLLRKFRTNFFRISVFQIINHYLTKGGKDPSFLDRFRYYEIYLSAERGELNRYTIYLNLRPPSKETFVDKLIPPSPPTPPLPPKEKYIQYPLSLSDTFRLLKFQEEMLRSMGQPMERETPPSLFNRNYRKAEELAKKLGLTF